MRRVNRTCIFYPIDNYGKYSSISIMLVDIAIMENINDSSDINIIGAGGEQI